jgi:hypothetical protein
MHNDASTAHSSDHVNFSAPASLQNGLPLEISEVAKPPIHT